MHKQPASRSIQAQHSEAYGKLPFDDTADFDLVERGFIATIKPNVIHDDKGAVIWDNDSYGDFSGDAPSTVHPSLWRQSRAGCTGGTLRGHRGHLPGTWTRPFQCDIH